MKRGDRHVVLAVEWVILDGRRNNPAVLGSAHAEAQAAGRLEMELVLLTT